MLKKILCIAVMTSALSAFADEPDKEAEAPLLGELQQKYNLKSHDKNLQDLDSLNSKFRAGDKGASDSRALNALSRMLSFESEEDTRDRPFDSINITSGQQNVLKGNSASWASGAAGTAGMPALNDQGTFDVEYSQSGTRRVTRNLDGTMNVQSIDGGPMRSGGLGLEDVYSTDVNNPEHSGFENIKSSYGDESSLYSHGGQHLYGLEQTSKRTGDAVSYRTIKESAENNARKTLNDNFVQSSLDFLTNTQNDPSDFFSSCTSTTEKRVIGAEGEITTVIECTDFDDSNYDFCEINREIVKVEKRKLTTTPVRCEAEEDKFCGITWGHNQSCYLCYDNVGWTEKVIVDNPGRPYYQECETPEQDLTYGCRVNGGWEEVSYEDITESGGFNVTSFSTFNTQNQEEDKILPSDGGGAGETMYRITEKTVQFPEGCADRVDEPGGELDPPETLCVFDGYTAMDEGSNGFPQRLLDKMEPLYPGDLGNVTWRVNLDGYRCEPFGAEGVCIETYDGGEQCFSWDELKDSYEDECQQYKYNSSCEVTKRECNESTRDSNGVCRFFDVEYTCTESIGGTSEVEVSSNVCNSMIPCAGGDCDNTNNETNEDFVKAAAQASVLDNINSDMTCDPDNPTDCEIFKATYGSCAKPVGGSPGKAFKLAGPNCCVDPTAPSLTDYIKAAAAVSQFKSVQKLSSYGKTAIAGGWDKITSTSAWETMSQPFSSIADSFGGNAAGNTGAGNIFNNGMEKLTSATMQWMANNLPTQMTHAMFATETVQEGGEQVVKLMDPPEWSETMQGVGNFAQGLMSAYGYYTTLKLAMDLLFQCKDSETQVSGSLAQKACVYTGRGSCLVGLSIGGCQRRRYNYCCFNSMLGRIITEQAAEQLNRPLGAGAECKGLTMQELSQVDWSRIDLESEWIPMMFESGLIPAETTEEGLTGSGRTMNADYRQLVSLRTMERLGLVDEETLARMRAEVKEPLDCSDLPRPAVCYYNEGANN